jgi:hypothetical protein
MGSNRWFGAMISRFNRLTTVLLLAIHLGSTSVEGNNASISKEPIEPNRGQGCVTVVKAPMTVQKRVSGKASAPGFPPAFTVWSFHCTPGFEYDIVDKKVAQEFQKVSLKITKAEVKISLSITITLPEHAGKRVIEHEEGHVKICASAYATAGKKAEDAAGAVIGRTFQGQGADLDLACQSALQKAASQLSASYRKGTVDYVNAVSHLYDKIDAKKALPVDVEIKLARKQAAQ